ncbi:MAG TPA: phosphatase PAP2 family protein [Candidatus Saccharibacteria bacterium]|jgi:undecaprenyl-diphosphatase|nr:phosphatase PAP2 family protein [Candidatus Saccharibacteria bacterium]HMR38440.1 phosphatase PAP2 family protein [Candidatus Saccharibacteria bacterium]
MEVFIKFIADWLMIPIGLLAFYAFAFVVPVKKWKYWGPRVFLAGVTTYVVAKLAGLLFQPETMRPFEKLGVEPGAAFLNNPGFPSDHALFAMFLTLAVWYSTRNKWLAGAMLGMTLLVGVGRVLALVHTPVDVLGGLLIASVGILWYRRSTKKVVK